MLAGLIALCACASSQPAVKHVAQRTAIEAEVQVLKQVVAERDRALNELENRLALLEAEQRQLRYALSEAESKAQARETARDGSRRPERSDASPPDFVASLDASSEQRRREPRPFLRLFGERRHSASDALLPVPVVNERLPIAPLPELAALPAQGAVPGDAGSHYLQAIDLVRKREFEPALLALTDFLVRYPSDARAPKVMFWRGEVLFAQRDYARALAAFESALAKDPAGDRAADALLKAGLCHKRLGSPERARAIIERLKAQFPQSDAARRAAQEDA